MSNEYKFEFETLPDFVSGPISLTEHYHPILDKHIYVFGDEHRVDPDPCYGRASPERILPIHLFIEQLILNQPYGQVIDVFLEEKMRFKSIDRPRPYIYDLTQGDDLQNLRRYFNAYLEVDKMYDTHGFQDPITGIPRARFHYTDVRLVDYNTFPVNIQKEFRNLLVLSSLYVDFSPLDSLNTLDSAYDNLKRLNREGLKFDLMALEKKFGLIKEIEKIKDTDLQNRFKLLLEEERRRTILEFFDKMRKFGVGRYEQMIQMIDILVFIKIGMLNYIMDLYLMARIFKQVQGGFPFERVIIYAGEEHANYYRDILEVLDFQQNPSFNSKPIQTVFSVKCVDIRPFKPFFDQTKFFY